jgi:hypothetical protein
VFLLYPSDIQSQAIYLWPLESTHSETGKIARIHDRKNLILSDDLRITEADGGYDAKEYERQIQ